MNQLDADEIRLFYESVEDVWPKDDLWHQYSKKEIEHYILSQSFASDAYILNAGSGGNTYDLSYRMHHVDIVKDKIKCHPEYTVCSIETLPFAQNVFSDVLCVGSVLNYCDALSAISELSRVLKQNGRLILEFESSWGFEHIRKKEYKQSASLVDLSYFGESHKQWVYAPSYIKEVLKQSGFSITHLHQFHYMSGLHYSMNQNENEAAKYTCFDAICRIIPYIKLHANNIIFSCLKL